MQRKRRVAKMDINEIKFEQLEGDQRELAEVIGIEAYIKLVINYGGSFVYICKAGTILKNNRNNEICNKFNGSNYRELAKEYNLSEKMIREITSEKLKEIKRTPPSSQMKLW